MCLSVVDQIHEPALPEERWAWKAFSREPGGPLLFWVRYHRESRKVRRGCWLRAYWPYGNTGLFDDRGRVYPPGFHALLTRREARLMAYAREDVVLKVKIRKICAEGKQGVLHTIIAQEMFVPLPKKGKKCKKN